MSKTEPTRIRKPRPRHPDVIIGAIEERLMTMETMCKADAVLGGNVDRLKELFDELRRARNGKADAEE